MEIVHTAPSIARLLERMPAPYTPEPDRIASSRHELECESEMQRYGSHCSCGLHRTCDPMAR
jgi:hypothetical protein